MADITRGLKAGFGAGIISGLLGGIISVVLMFTILYPEYKAVFERVLAGAPPDTFGADILMMISAIAIIPMALIIGAIIGVIIGLIYAFLYNKLPGKTAIPKGLFIGLVCFILISIFSLLGKVAISEDAASAGIEQSPLMVGTGYATNFVIALIFGYFLGRFWSDLEPED